MKKKALLLSLIFGLFPIHVHAETAAEKSGKQVETDVSAFLFALEEKMSGIKTVQSGFVQEKKLVVFDQPLVLKGTIYMEKPAHFAWHVREPVRYTMVIEDDIVRQWDEDTGQVQQMSLSKNPAIETVIQQMGHWFSGTYATLLQEYHVTVRQKDPLSLTFAPIKGTVANGIIESVTVLFRDDGRYIRQIHIQENEGDSTLLTFFDTLLNAPIEPAAWKVNHVVQ